MHNVRRKHSQLRYRGIQFLIPETVYCSSEKGRLIGIVVYSE